MTNQEITTQAEELFKGIMQMYWAYLELLEVAFRHTQPDDLQRLEAIRQQAEEIKLAMQHDIGLFDKAIGQDQEAIKKYDESDQIQNIQKMLASKN